MAARSAASAIECVNDRQDLESEFVNFISCSKLYFVNRKDDTIEPNLYELASTGDSVRWCVWFAVFGFLVDRLAIALGVVFARFDDFAQNVSEGDDMKRKTKVMIGLAVSGGTTVIFFIKYLLKTISFIKHPLDFSVGVLFAMIGLLVLLFVHAVGYVHFMDMQEKRFEVEDDELWYTKWDRT